MRYAGKEVRYDEGAKRLLAHRQILAPILKTCVSELEDFSISEIVQTCLEGEPQIGKAPVSADTRIHGIHTEEASLSEGTIRYDLRFFVSVPSKGEEKKERLRLIMNVEAQNRFYPGYPLIKRGIYYGSRMLSGQYGTEFTGADYGKLKKVYSIWICTNPPIERQNTIVRYVIDQKPMIGTVRESKSDYDLMNVVLIGLGKPTGKNYGGLLRFLEVLFSTQRSYEEKKEILGGEYHLFLEGETEEEVKRMCNLSQGILEEGIKQGMRQGRKQGSLHTRREIACALAERGMSVEEISRIVKVNKEQVNKWV